MWGTGAPAKGLAKSTAYNGESPTSACIPRIKSNNINGLREEGVNIWGIEGSPPPSRGDWPLQHRSAVVPLIGESNRKSRFFNFLPPLPPVRPFSILSYYFYYILYGGFNWGIMWGKVGDCCK